MRCSVTVLTLIFSVAVFLLQAAPTQADVKFKSARPRFAKIALNQDASKVLSVAFDESKGTGRGYDTLYADTNFNVRFEESERRPAENIGADLPEGFFMSMFSVFPRVSFFSKPGWTVQPEEVMIRYGELPAMRSRQRESTFSASLYFTLSRGSTLWYYDLRATIELADALSVCPITKFSMPPKVKITTMPDRAKPWNTGIGLGVVLGTAELTCYSERNEYRVTSDLAIKNAAGKVIRRNRGVFGYG